MGKIVTLLTDFGFEDSYVAEVKAVLLSAGPSTRVIDITHSVPPFDVERGAFQLLRSYHYFPKGTFHLAVIDPGVGTSRRGIYVRTQRYHFVGPDNGLLLWAVRDCERREKKKAKIYELPLKKALLPTFHGRDLFSPYVVRLMKNSSTRLKLVKPGELEGREFPICRELGGVQRGEILCPDHFGNIVTSIPYGDLKHAEVQVQHYQDRLPAVDTYQSIEPDGVAIVRGSHGFWEIACKEGSAWDKLDVSVGDEVTLTPLSES